MQKRVPAVLVMILFCSLALAQPTISQVNPQDNHGPTFAMYHNTSFFSDNFLLQAATPEVVWPLPGFYYITDYLVVELETDEAAVCEYDFNGNGFTAMVDFNGTIHYADLYDLADNMQSFEPYIIDFRCIDAFDAESTTFTYFWINTSPLDDLYIRDDIGSWDYNASYLSWWSGDTEGHYETYISVYSKPDESFHHVDFFVTDGPASVAAFVEDYIFGLYENVTLTVINDSNVYTFYDSDDIRHVVWTHDTYVISTLFYRWVGDDAIAIPIPLEIIGAYLERYPSDLRDGICGDGNTNILNLDGFSEECDGDIEVMSCGSDIGMCTLGETTRTCTSECTWNEWSMCSGTAPATDICDGLDNNCDGTTDEDFSDLGLTCTVGIGACMNDGAYICSIDGLGSVCSVEPHEPTAEVCDGLDNDCDGEVDEEDVCTIFLYTHEPSADLFSERRVPFNITTSEVVEEISYIDWNDRRPRERRLCRNCDEYGFFRSRTKSFRDGLHTLTFYALTDDVVVAATNKTFLVDSRKPKISRTSPTRGYANGTFSTFFTEDNPVSLILVYGNTETGFQQHIMTIASMNESYESCIPDNRGRMECFITVNLSEYDGERISYFFNVTDITGASDTSRERPLEVDVTPPLINSFNYTTDSRRRIEFFFNITENNFEEVAYIDWDDRRPRERRLCSRLRDGTCEVRKSFGSGTHNLTLTTLDEAGNSAEPINLNMTCDRYTCDVTYIMPPIEEENDPEPPMNETDPPINETDPPVNETDPPENETEPVPCNDTTLGETYVLRFTNFKTENQVNKTTLQYWGGNGWVTRADDRGPGSVITIGKTKLKILSVNKVEKIAEFEMLSDGGFDRIYSTSGNYIKIRTDALPTNTYADVIYNSDHEVIGNFTALLEPDSQRPWIFEAMGLSTVSDFNLTAGSDDYVRFENLSVKGTHINLAFLYLTGFNNFSYIGFGKDADELTGFSDTKFLTFDADYYSYFIASYYVC